MNWHDPWPRISRNPEDILRLKPPVYGLDWEWNVRDERPTIMGVADAETAVGTTHEQGLPYLQALAANQPNVTWTGHNFVQADLRVARATGVQIRLEQVEDTIIRHWLVNSCLCKSTRKSSLEDDEGERKGRGFMSLWHAASLTTWLPNWKACRGAHCAGPCPEHDPFAYCAVDAWSAVVMLPRLKQQCQLWGVEKHYAFHRDLLDMLADMRQRGIPTDVPYVAELRGEFAAEGERLEKTLPFNPRSPKAVVAYFAAKGIALENAQETTIEDACDSSTDTDLHALLAYKQIGNGPDRWFAPREWNYKTREWDGYLYPDGFVRPRLAIFTSTGRLNCTSPNFQNVSKRRKLAGGIKIGEKVRRAAIAPEGYWWVRSDLSNAENRTFLHLAGYDVPREVDLHEWVKEIAEVKETDPMAIALGGARDAAKSIQHANYYGEGLSLISPAELRSPRIRREIDAGARNVFPDWSFEGKIVTFTGINLANRAFGSASWENRKAALQISEQIFARFPRVRSLQRDILRQCERDRCVRTPLGYVLSSYGFPADRAKTALACWGSQPVAHITKLALLACRNHPVLDVRLQVHDEADFVVDKRHEPSKIAASVREVMEQEIPEMQGLRIPCEVSLGSNWAVQESL